MTAYFKKARTCTVVVLIAVLLCSICFMPEQAEAATKYQLVKQEHSDVRVQAAGGYYWFDWDYSGDDNGLNLYYSSTKEGLGKMLAKDVSSISCALTNGSKVYYVKVESDFQKGTSTSRIYSVSLSGKNRKLVKKITQRDEFGYVALVGIYNGSLYYETRLDYGYQDGKKTQLYCLNLKSGKSKRVSSDYTTLYGYSGGSDRYIYGNSIGKNGARVFDCKTNKIIRTIKDVSKVRVVDGKLIYITSNYEKNLKEICRASLSGANQKVLLSLPYDSYIDRIGAKTVYFQQPVQSADGEWENSFHHYDLASGENLVVTADEYGGFDFE